MEGAGKMRWDVEPVNGKSSFFSNAAYEKYSLRPTLAEFLLLANKTGKVPESAPENAEKGPVPQPAVPEVKSEVVKPLEEDLTLPEPRVPYPHFSSLDAVEQRLYVRFMIKYMSRKGFKPDVIQQKDFEHYQILKTKCSSENVQFQKYLQNSARKCAEDYNCISAVAELYVQELLKACQKYVTNYPKFYTLHEVTSILGGKFIPDLTLKLEKCLLLKGAAQFVRLLFPTSELDLPTTFKKVSSSVPPASKAAEMHTSVSSDPNTTKLSEKYCPHVTMTSQVLYTLLNNHGPSYKEQWEIPLCVKTITNAEGKSSKIIYMDSPLPKKEMTIREKSQIFHEVPLDLFMLKKSAVLVNIMQLDKTGEGQYTFTEDSRSVLQESGENMEVDFENDLTELETFGTSQHPPKVAKLLQSEAAPKAAELLQSEAAPKAAKPLESEATPKSAPLSVERTLMNKLMMEKQIIRASSGGDGDGKDQVMPELKANSTIQSLLSDSDDTSSFKGFESDELKDFKNRGTSSEGCSSEEDTEGSGSVSTSKISRGTVKRPLAETLNEGDSSDDDQLVIDIGCDGKVASHSGTRTPPSLPNVQESAILPKKPARRLSKQFDPVGQILKMQTRLLKPDPKKMQEPSAVNQMQLPAAIPPVTPMSEPEDAPKNTMYPPSDFKKPLLPVNLLTSKDDEMEFPSPPNGSCTYKLYSLGDLLLLIQGRVHKALTRVRAHKKSTRVQLPVYVLTKMDYQTCFGAEMLTESESCRLWTESLLHSSSLLYVGHIDALTSKFFMLEEISQEGLKDRFGTFKPANSLVTLRHILKLVTGLENGSYLLSHSSGDSSVSIYKSVPSFVRGVYDLHKAHSSLPKAPTSLSVPWVPVDPNILLPIHTNHCWPPCTFPPQERLPASLLKEFRRSNPGASLQPATSNPAANKTTKKNKGKRKNRLLKWRAKCTEWKEKAAQKKKTLNG